MAYQQPPSYQDSNPFRHVDSQPANRDRGFATDAAHSVLKRNSSLEPYLRQAAPYIVSCAQTIDVLSPYVEALWKFLLVIWAKAQQYHLVEEYGPMAAGALLVFYGGQFPMMVAAVEAFRICGWQSTKAAVVRLYKCYEIAKAASDKDDLVDEDKDGIPDVKQISASQLLTRKFQIFLKATDPAEVHNGIMGLTSGLTAVVATLRLQFAHTVTLGITLGGMFSQGADQVLRPALEGILPVVYHKWIGMGITYCCKSLAVWIAWWFTRVMCAFHSAMRGSQMFMLGLLAVLQMYQVNVPMNFNAKHPSFPGVCFALGLFGFYTQLSTGFTLPFPFNILLIPVRLAEWVLTYFVVDE